MPSPAALYIATYRFLDQTIRVCADMPDILKSLGPRHDAEALFSGLTCLAHAPGPRLGRDEKAPDATAGLALAAVR